jgi:hypothetical protein
MQIAARSAASGKRATTCQRRVSTNTIEDRSDEGWMVMARGIDKGAWRIMNLETELRLKKDTTRLQAHWAIQLRNVSHVSG